MNASRTMLALPLLVQAIAMMVDELHFHRARGLGRWERVGHPLDTLTVLACIAWALTRDPSPRAIAIYCLLAIVSCVFVTKDEIVHARRCSAGEHWLHALLFVLHPTCLACLGLVWATKNPALTRVLAFQACLTFGFFAYQTLYWNVPWKRRAPRAR